MRPKDPYEFKNDESFWGKTKANFYKDVEIDLANPEQFKLIGESLSFGDPNQSKKIINKLLRLKRRGKKSASIVAFMPEFARDNTNILPICHQDKLGPNCFYAALNWHRDMGKPRHVTSNELEQVIEAFKIIPKGQPLKFGDLILIRYKKTNEARHMAVYLNSHILWHLKTRKGVNDYPYSFQSTSEATFDMYFDPKDHFMEFYRY